ncbi:MAG: cell division protein FtsA [Rhizobiales bacterium]|nr:cell division protein FtsA [Hyphomicrobiales bacterium]
MTLMTFRELSGLAGNDQQGRGAVFAALDIGTQKVACAIARVRPMGAGADPANVRVIGFGHHESRGVKSGVIVDLAAAEKSIRGAIDAAEAKAGLTVDEVIVNASCGRIRSEIYEIGVPVATGQVSEGDLDRVLHTARAQPREDQRLTLHSMPLGYALDEHEGVRDPLGMYGSRLSVGMHVVTAEPAPLRNLALGVDRTHVSINRVAVSPLVSALASLTADEADVGAMCVDMGAGCTTLAVFADGLFVHADGIALGGQHVTLDLARGLSTPLAEAERLKVLHGSVLTNTHDDGEFVNTAPLGEADAGATVQRVQKSQITRIVRPRVEETFELLRDRLAQSGAGGLRGRTIVLTGGASQLAGIEDLAANILGGEVRLGAPRGLLGAPANAAGPGFSTLVGLVSYAQTQEVVPRSALAGASDDHEGSYFVRVGRWLKQGF